MCKPLCRLNKKKLPKIFRSYNKVKQEHMSAAVPPPYPYGPYGPVVARPPVNVQTTTLSYPGQAVAVVPVEPKMGIKSAGCIWIIVLLFVGAAIVLLIIFLVRDSAATSAAANAAASLASGNNSPTAVVVSPSNGAPLARYRGGVPSVSSSTPPTSSPPISNSYSTAPYLASNAMLSAGVKIPSNPSSNSYGTYPSPPSPSQASQPRSNGSCGMAPSNGPVPQPGGSLGASSSMSGVPSMYQYEIPQRSPPPSPTQKPSLSATPSSPTSTTSTPSRVKSISSADLQNIEQSKQSGVLVFSMARCPHCVTLKPNYDTASTLVPNVNCWLAMRDAVTPEQMKRYNVKGFPTIVKIKNGMAVDDYSGSRTPEALAAWAQT